MKKILLLATVMMLFAAVGLMAQVSFSGDVDFETGINVDADRATPSATDMDGGDIDFDVSAAPDDYTSITIEMGADAIGADQSVNLGEASFTTDLGAWLAGEMGVELPVGITYNMSNDGQDYADVAENTSYEFEALAATDIGSDFISQKLNISVMEIANVYAASGVSQSFDAEENSALLFGVDAGVDVGVGMVMVELVYGTDSDSGSDAGDVGFGFSFSSDQLVEGLDGTFGASVTMLGDDGRDAEYEDVDVDEDFLYGVGGSIDYAGLVWADMSFGGAIGETGDDIKVLGMGLGSDVTDFLSVGSGMVLWLGDGDVNNDELLHNAEMYLQFSQGAVTYTVGYFWYAEDALVEATDLETPTADYSNVYFTAGASF